VAAVSVAGSLFAFSVERWDEDFVDSQAALKDVAGKFLLGEETHRYKHNVDYVQQAFQQAGFKHVHSKETTGRFEKGLAVSHSLFLVVYGT
jgi:predicted TPR repeat methyltransferase